MAGTTKIEWTGKVWNPTKGCSRGSPGCARCYAERQAIRQSGEGKPYEGLVCSRSSGPRWTGEVRMVDEELDAPLRWQAPSKVFVDSMSDLFHNDVDDFFIGEVFGVMRAARQHQFQLLTKRSARMAKLLSKFAVPENVWIGVSVESSQYLSRVDDLLQVDARVRFLSIEPLIAPVGQLPLQNIHWVIVGGESGPRARPMNPLWATSVRDQCVAAAVPFFFKQWGGVHKGANGRVLDGRTWDEFPALRAQAPARRHLTVLGGAR